MASCARCNSRILHSFGLLHRIPPQTSDQPPIPEELEDSGDEHEEQDLFVPADLQPGHYHSPPLAQWRDRSNSEESKVYTPVPKVSTQLQPPFHLSTSEDEPTASES